MIAVVAETSIDIQPSKNQALCENCTHVRQRYKVMIINITP